MEHLEKEISLISRSGRVCKKSSKLVDLDEPLLEIEGKGRHKNSKKERSISRKLATVGSSDSEEFGDDKSDIFSSNDSISGFSSLGAEDSMDSVPKDATDYSLDENSVNSRLDPAPDSNKQPRFYTPKGSGKMKSQAQSLYMQEKQTKKQAAKEAKAAGRLQRKDKGKTRVSAYVMWTKGMRKQVSSQNPEMGFAAISKRLGEMWASLPTNEKNTWKRKAKNLAVKGKVANQNAVYRKSKIIKTAKPSRPIGRPRTRELPIPTDQVVNDKASKQQADRQSRLSDSTQLLDAGSVSPSYKVTGTSPIDLAAHLVLLGESLSVIGDRLKEHEGQIAVSGSLSVLLDSLLCAVGPLICMTQFVQTTNVIPKPLLDKILDNIAYIMPGL